MSARVQHPAPVFKGTAVVDGAFEGEPAAPLAVSTLTSARYRPPGLPGQVARPRIHPDGLDLRLVMLPPVPPAPMLTRSSSPTEIIAFSDAHKQFEERNTQVVFASVDSEYSLLSWASTARKDGGLGGVNIPLLSDKNHKISRDYGVLLEEDGVALRGLFLIDPEGTIRQITINDLPVGRSVDETIRLVDAFQFVEKVCVVGGPLGCASPLILGG
jgi:peroxiredoxin (alkyl hydroperoxide reductase subunit C)